MGKSYRAKIGPAIQIRVELNIDQDEGESPLRSGVKQAQTTAADLLSGCESFPLSRCCSAIINGLLNQVPLVLAGSAMVSRCFDDCGEGAEMEYHPFWFGVRLELVCPLCCITSVKMGVINWPTDHIENVKARIDRESLSCPHCKAPFAHEAEVDVAIVPGTPEYLRTLGFQIPVVPLALSR